MSVLIPEQELVLEKNTLSWPNSALRLSAAFQFSVSGQGQNGAKTQCVWSFSKSDRLFTNTRKGWLRSSDLRQGSGVRAAAWLNSQGPKELGRRRWNRWGKKKKVAGFQSIWHVVFQRLQILHSHLSCYCLCSSQWQFFLFWHLIVFYAFTPFFTSQKDILILKEKCVQNQSCGFQTSCLASSPAQEVFVEWKREWMRWFSRKSYEESLPLAKVGLFFFQKLGIITLSILYGIW